MDAQAFLKSLEDDPGYAGQIVHRHTEPAAPPQWAPVPSQLASDVHRFLRAHGITRLYRHQADAIDAALAGRDVLITTGPASGKSLCFQIPILQRLTEQEAATALLVFPTKALARDQSASWNRGLKPLHGDHGPRPPSASPFDADTDAGTRRACRLSRVLVTNPEMLHARLLPNHGRWSTFFQGLSYVVLDEVHSYTGFFGANMANVIRRLERVCAHYGSRPRFFFCSATVANPTELAVSLAGRAFHHVSEDTSETGQRTFVLWNPPRVRGRRWRGRRSANVEAHELMIDLLRRRIGTICFGKARNTAEMIYRYVREGLGKHESSLAERVAVYRGGYAPAERRDMESRLRDGDLLGVSATRALELGIDVGMLEACIIIGYPGTLNAFFQQAGRAGRGRGDSLCILVGTDTPINQYVMRHPEFLFGRPIERAVADSDNPFVVLGHLRCAAAELPVTLADKPRFGYAAQLALDVLEEKQKLLRNNDVWYHSAPEQPAHEIRLRGYGDESTVIIDADSGKIIDRLDKFRALRIFYPGAIYFRRGDTYQMLDHDTDQNIVQVRRTDVPYYTDPLTGTSVNHVDFILDQRPIGTGTAYLGEVFAVLGVFCYEKVRFYTVDRVSMHPTSVPPVAYEAMSFWLEPPGHIPLETARLGLDPESGMKGILYCASRILPLFLTSDANDFDWSLGCRNTSQNTMFWFEFYLKGIGHSEQCYERLEEILDLTLEHLLTCDCRDGCPNCTSRLITPYHVRNIELGEGTVPSRRAAVVILNSLLTGQSPADSLGLLDTPGRQRGMALLPTVTGERVQPEPHRLPLDERTRKLMLRKLERERNTKEPVDHPIELIPPEGPPPAEREETLGLADSARRSRSTSVRRSAPRLSRLVRQRVSDLPHGEFSDRTPQPPGPTRTSPAETQDPGAAPSTAPGARPSPPGERPRGQVPQTRPLARESLPPPPPPLVAGTAEEPREPPSSPDNSAPGRPTHSASDLASRVRRRKRSREPREADPPPTPGPRPQTGRGPAGRAS